MECGFNLLCVDNSALHLYHRYKDWALICAVWKCMPLVTWEKRTVNRKIDCFSKYIQLCVLLTTVMSMQETPHVFNCTYLYYVKRKKYITSVVPKAFALLLYFSSKQASLLYDLFPLHLSLCLGPLCAQSSRRTTLTGPFPFQLLPWSSFPVLYRLTFTGIIPTHLQLLF